MLNSHLATIVSAARITTGVECERRFAVLQGVEAACDITGLFARLIRESLGAVVLVPLIAIAVASQAAGRAQAPPADAAARARALMSTIKRGREPEVACNQLDESVGDALIALSERARTESYEPAAIALRLAERAGRCSGSDRIVGTALNGLSDVLLALGDFEGALATARDSVAIHTRLHDDVGLAEAWNRIGNAQSWLNDRPASIDAFQRALDLSTAVDDRAGQARAWNNLANAHRNLGEFDAALDYLTKALRVFEDMRDWPRAAVVTNNIGLVYFNRGEYATALEYNRRAQELNRTAGNLTRLAASYDSAGNIYRALGAYRSALESFQQALAMRSSNGDRAGLMETTHNIGLVHFAQGDYQLAIAAYRQGLRLNRTMHDQTFAAEALRNIGAAAWQLGERERAAANFRESLLLARHEHLRPMEAELFRDLGQMELADGRIANAARHGDEALQISQDAGDQAGVTAALTLLASARLAEHRPDAAVELGERAAANARAHDEPELLWPAETVVGVADRQLHRPEAARQALGAAIQSIEQLSSATSGSESLRQRFFEDKLSPYHELVELSIEEGNFGEALELAERSKARVLTQLLRGSRPDDTVLSADEARERRRLLDALYSFNRRIESEQGKPAPDQSRLNALESSRRATREEQAAFESLLVARHPTLAAGRGAVRPMTLTDAAALLNDRATAAVEYVVAARRLFVFLVTSKDGHLSVEGHSTNITAAALAARAERFRERIGTRDFAVGDDARALYNLLLSPLKDHLAGKTQLIIIPDSTLWNVPFQALIGDHGYLIEQAAISYAPSLAVLREIRQLPKPTGARTLMAIGKAQFGGDVANRLAALPDAETQVQLIRNLYGSDRSIALVGNDATETQFKKLAPHYSVLHLATHGVLDEASPMYSYLALSPSDDDGRLEAWELMRLNLAADLVVLAACDTGRGRIAPGEGVIGTMWALFAAGARSMVASQFSVESKSTTALLVAFHRRLAAGVGSKSEHLRAAALELLHTPRFAHPYYWAGFVLVGDAD